MSDKHLSTQFDAELSGISTRVLEMGGLAESQVSQAVHALTQRVPQRRCLARCCGVRSAASRGPSSRRVR